MYAMHGCETFDFTSRAFCHCAPVITGGFALISDTLRLARTVDTWNIIRCSTAVLGSHMLDLVHGDNTHTFV